MAIAIMRPPQKQDHKQASLEVPEQLIEFLQTNCIDHEGKDIRPYFLVDNHFQAELIKKAKQ